MLPSIPVSTCVSRSPTEISYKDADDNSVSKYNENTTELASKFQLKHHCRLLLEFSSLS